MEVREAKSKKNKNKNYTVRQMSGSQNTSEFHFDAIS
jgi:hypothetical protein